VEIGGYVDAYYGYDFNRPASGNRDYFVSSARHNEMSINLAFVDVKYNSSRLRARFAPGFGTYINANYANEPGSLKNIVEGSVGLRPFRNKNIWIDGGIIGSPFTPETPISKDQLMYTRSIGSEYFPYYLSGLKVSWPLHQKLNFYLYLINGWQQIADQNKGKSVGTQFEYKPSDQWLVNWNTYLGDERSVLTPNFRTRYFSDVFITFSGKKISASGCIYGGVQNSIVPGGSFQSFKWWNANLIGRFTFNKKVSLSGRVEYFSDPQSAMIVPVTPVYGFNTYSSGLCLNLHLASNAIVRFEGRSFFSSKDVFQDSGKASSSSNMLISNLTIWF
jgi:hypothetical protein